MIRHIVLTKFKPETTEDEIADIYAGLSALTDKRSGARGFTGGRSASPEQIERGYMHGFVIDFDSWKNLKAYAEHSEHRKLGARIVENAVGGIDGILVLDIEVPE
ncbi:Dabb family protein [Aquibium carbonis]|uniref:Dabb family protein n=1 Tax=Aquibium carbonis TaxID=2495581 RepID=A0A429Z351_9HYPH|nr:Dabb family protein [Aquibium carbonis]RST88050.1 Dabb family protein [Aquibium carbonis]